MHIFDRVTCLAPDCRSLSARKNPYCADHIPVFYRDQDDLKERPCMIATLTEAREMKGESAGKFENRGRTFRLYQSRPEPVMRDSGLPNLERFVPLVEGRNSCRRVGDYPDFSYNVKHFSYPVPACVEPKIGARRRFTVRSRGVLPEINEVPTELLVHAASLNQVQA